MLFLAEAAQGGGDGAMLSLIASLGSSAAAVAVTWFFLDFLRSQNAAHQRSQDERDSQQRELFALLQSKFELLARDSNAFMKENTASVKENSVTTERLRNAVLSLATGVQVLTGKSVEIAKATTELKDAIKEPPL